MKSAKTKTAKPKSAQATATKKRVRAVPKHRTFKLSKKRLKQAQPIPSALRLFKDSYIVLKNNKRIFIGLALLNAVIALIFISGFSAAFDIVDFKHSLTDLVDGHSDQLYTAVTVFGYLLSSASSAASESAGVYQLIWS